MMRISYAISALVIVGILLGSHGYAQAADIPRSKQLTDAQLDRIAAGIPAGAFAFAVADGSATGKLSTTETTVTAIVPTGGQLAGGASGHVTSIGISTAGATATASSSLSLTLGFP